MKQPSPEEIAAGLTRTYRGWNIHRCEWLGWSATGPNYDASYEGPEDGWVDNGEKVDAGTYAVLIDEINAYIEEHPDATC